MLESTRPTEADDFLAQILSAGRREPRPEQRDSRVLPLETRSLAELHPTSLNEAGDALDSSMLSDQLVVGVRLVHAARIGSNESLLQASQPLHVPYETEQHALEPRRARVVLLVRIRRGGDDRIDRRGRQQFIQPAGVRRWTVASVGVRPRNVARSPAIVSDPVQPGADDRCILPNLPDTKPPGRSAGSLSLRPTLPREPVVRERTPRRHGAVPVRRAARGSCEAARG